LSSSQSAHARNEARDPFAVLRVRTHKHCPIGKFEFAESDPRGDHAARERKSRRIYYTFCLKPEACGHDRLKHGIVARDFFVEPMCDKLAYPVEHVDIKWRPCIEMP
jgi:hypothetical protein